MQTLKLGGPLNSIRAFRRAPLALMARAADAGDMVEIIDF